MRIDSLNSRLATLRHRWTLAALAVAAAALAAWLVGFIAGLVVVWFNAAG